MPEDAPEMPATVTMTCGCGNVAEVEPESTWLTSWRCPRCFQRQSILTVQVDHPNPNKTSPLPQIRMRSSQGFAARGSIDHQYEGDARHTTGAE